MEVLCRDSAGVDHCFDHDGRQPAEAGVPASTTEVVRLARTRYIIDSPALQPQSLTGEAWLPPPA